MDEQNNVSFVAYQTYQVSTTRPNLATVIQEVEESLRTLGCVVHYDAARRVVWQFYITSKGGTLSGSSPGHRPVLPSGFEIAGVTLTPIDDGSFEPANLPPPPRVPSPHGTNTPTRAPSSASPLDQRSASGYGATPTPGGWGSVDTGVLMPFGSNDPKEVNLGAITTTEAYEKFIAAALATVLLCFARKTGAIPLDFWTLILAPRRGVDEPRDRTSTKPCALVSLRIYLTTTGSLILIVCLKSAEGLSSLELVPNGLGSVNGETQIIAAPLGVPAKYQAFADGSISVLDGGVGQTPDGGQLWRRNDAKTSLWKQECTKLLQLRGVAPQAVDLSSWITIQISRLGISDQRATGKAVLGGTTTILWPASLCFRRKASSSPPTSRLGGTMLVGHEESYDPLASARAWFQEAPERDEKMAKKRKEREAAAAAAVDRNRAEDGRAQPPQPPDANSPLALHRTGNLAAAGSMYPTPPDGVQNPHGITPSLDGTVSSPANQASTVAVVDIDTVMGNAGPAGDSYGDTWEGGDVKREQHDATYLGDGGDLFDGDMENVGFNDADMVTDADFNFFDDQLRADLELGDFSDMVPDTPATSAPSHQGASTSFGAARPKSTSVSRSTSVKPETDAPVFAKPELKHARSILNDEGRSASTTLANGGAPVPPPPYKREASPFDPKTVFKRVRASLAQHSDRHTPKPLGRRGSVYDKDDGLILPPVNSKYANGGKYAYSNWESTRANSNISTGMPPTTEYLKRHGKHTKGDWKGSSESHGALIAKLTSGMTLPASLQPAAPKDDDVASDADDTSVMSDQDDMSVSSDGGASPVKSSIRRPNLEDDSASQSTSFRDADMSYEPDASVVLDLPKLYKADGQHLSLSKFFADPEPLPLHLSLADEDMVTVAQILAEQAALGSLMMPDENSYGSSCLAAVSTASERRRKMACMSRQAIRALIDAVPESLGEPSECTFREYVEIQEGYILGAPTRNFQPRPVPGREGSEVMKPPNIFQISCPHIQLKRSDSNLSILPSAVAFWESLGLGPSQGSKDIQAVCIFPGWDGMVDNVEVFLDRMRNTYESLKLGSFERLPTWGDIIGGHVGYEVEKISISPGNVFPRISTALADRTTSLCQALTASTESDKNFVVFYIYSPSNPSSIVEACTAFNQLFEDYKNALNDRKKPPNNEIVLQLVPLDFVGASTSVVISSLADVTRLCLETYDRCIMFGGESLPVPAPAIILEQVAPRTLDFKLSSTPSASLMHENSCIYVAYSVSIDGRWISAAWTDYRGTQQMTAAYCLGRKGRNLVMSFSDMAKEIWETTHDILSIYKVHWRVIITKTGGVMEQREKDSWTSLASTETKANVSLILTTVDTSPSLQLIPPAVKLSPALNIAFYSTPVSTPQPNILSPDQSGNPPTPSKEGGSTPGDPSSADPATAEGLLTDIIDQTWGCILSHRPPPSFATSSNSEQLQYATALQSGYLVKRGGTAPEDPPVLMEVDLVHSDGNPRAHEGLLRELLVHFRALGTLSRARGVTGSQDVRPWHVAAAEKGVKALYLLM